MGLSKRFLKMRTTKFLFSSIIFFSASLLAADEPVNRSHLSYLFQSGRFDKGIELYTQYHKDAGRHDFDLLNQMGLAVIQRGIRSDTTKVKLACLFAARNTGLSTSIDILASGINSRDPQLQLASIQLLSKIQDDRCDALLQKAMSSEYLSVRMEAGYQLSVRKHHISTGHMEALMHRLPRPYRVYFPEFFATIGSPESITVLKRLIEDRNLHVRIEAILCAARHGRDDLLPLIRKHLPHADPLELEACGAALGIFKDNHSLDALKKMAENQHDNVAISAIRSLYHLGNQEHLPKIVQYAKNGNPFATLLLGEFEGFENDLTKLTKHADSQIRMNAAIALLKRKDRRAFPALYDVLLHDSRDLALFPTFSNGKALKAWKTLPSSKQFEKLTKYDMTSITLSAREKLLRDARELSEADFIALARMIFDKKQFSLVPQTVSLLEKMDSANSKAVLEQFSQKAGAPLIRTYCQLALFKLSNGSRYRTELIQFVRNRKNASLFDFRSVIPRNPMVPSTHFQLTAEENASLLFGTYEALVRTHDPELLSLLLEVFKDGSEMNRLAISGMLLNALK